MKTSAKIANDIKEYIVQLAIDGQLNGDISQAISEDYLIEIIEKVNNSEEENKARCIEKAGLILYSDDDEDSLSLEKQIELIRQHADLSHDNEDDLIDTIEGVTPVQAAEWSYTCESFLTTIYY